MQAFLFLNLTSVTIALADAERGHALKDQSLIYGFMHSKASAKRSQGGSGR